jgi:hypothetical protein
MQKFIYSISLLLIFGCAMNYDQNLLMAPDISTQEKKINTPIDVNFAVINNLSDRLGEIRNLSGDLKGEIFLNSLSIDNMELVIGNELRNYGFRISNDKNLPSVELEITKLTVNTGKIAVAYTTELDLEFTLRVKNKGTINQISKNYTNTRQTVMPPELEANERVLNESISLLLNEVFETDLLKESFQ